MLGVLGQTLISDVMYIEINPKQVSTRIRCIIPIGRDAPNVQIHFTVFPQGGGAAACDPSGGDLGEMKRE